jgi:predicted Na+-dependent transporter
MLSIAVLPLTIPAFVLAGTGQQGDVAAFDAVSFLQSLCLDILLPTVAGKAVRELVPRAPQYIARTETATKYLASGCLIFLPFVTVSTSSDAIQQLPVGDFFLLLLIGAVVHGLLLAANALVCRFGWQLLRLDAGKRIAMILSCSGKSVPIAIAVLPLLGYAADTRGLLAVPLVFAQLTQTLMDGTLANHWAGQRSKHVEPGQAEQLQQPNSSSDQQQEAAADDGMAIELAPTAGLNEKIGTVGAPAAACAKTDPDLPLADIM